MIEGKREYKQQMWKFAAGAGYDTMKIYYDLIDLFETGAAEGKNVLEITGEDVAAFCEELLRSASTYTENWRRRSTATYRRNSVRGRI
jgi:DNA-binding ferritin-like protein (Dps family)